MKTLSRILLVAAVAGAIYLATIGRKDLYRIIDAVMAVIQAFAAIYTKK